MRVLDPSARPAPLARARGRVRSLAGPLALGALAACAAGLGLAACAPPPGSEVAAPSPAAPPDPPSAEPPAFTVALAAASEDGSALPPGSGAEVDGVLRLPGPDGRIALSGRGPVLAVLTAPGHLPEPVVIDRGDAASGAPILARLLRDRGPNGERRAVLHFAGDAMLGRRYLAPTAPHTAVVARGDGGASARAVVAALGPLFRAAHLRTLNLETVVGDLPEALAYPRKRFLLQSPPEVLDALDELGIQLVTLGNNHIRDWLELGVSSTLGALDQAGVAYAGGGLTAAEAALPALLEVEGMRVGTLSYTTVDGDFVNDSLPSATAPVPSNLSPDEAWQYEERLFGFRALGEPGHIPEALRRIGPAWTRLAGAETALDDAGRAELWLAAVQVYPELQDWVARRGHGGAARFAASGARADVAALRAAGADLVVVQIHAGFQFAEVRSPGVEQAAKASIDAGADLVIAHHPHVLQGFASYGGKLIAWSLGNILFDQDFLATFPSAVLRVVIEARAGAAPEVIEARVFPVTLDGYRPVPAAGRAARDIVRLLHDRSARGERAERVRGIVRAVGAPADPTLEPVHLVFERGTGRLAAGAAATSTRAVAASFAAPAALDTHALVRADAAAHGLLFGRDLFRAGGLEDVSADDRAAGGMHWDLDGAKRAEVRDDAPEGVRALRLRRTASNGARVIARPVARVTPLVHRLHDEATGQPLDGAASFSLRLVARREGDGVGNAFVRVELFHFDDQDPTVDPTSNRLRAIEIPFAVPADGLWREVIIDLPPSAFSPVGPLEINAALFYLGLEPPPSGTSILLCDEVAFVEWRDPATLVPGGLHAVDFVRAPSPAAGEVTRTLTLAGE